MSNLTFCSSVDTRNHVCSELLMDDADLKSGSWTEQKDSKRNESIMTERGLPGVDIRQSISFQKGKSAIKILKLSEAYIRCTVNTDKCPLHSLKRNMLLTSFR